MKGQVRRTGQKQHKRNGYNKLQTSNALCHAVNEYREDSRNNEREVTQYVSVCEGLSPLNDTRAALT